MVMAGMSPAFRPAEHRAVAEKFPDQAHRHQRTGEARPHAKPVQGGKAHAVAGGKRLRPAQDDAVDHNQGQVDAERLVNGGQIRLDQKLDDGGEARR